MAPLWKENRRRKEGRRGASKKIGVGEERSRKGKRKLVNEGRIKGGSEAGKTGETSASGSLVEERFSVFGGGLPAMIIPG